MTAVAFDFRKPPPDELAQQVAGWLVLACRRAAAPWSRLLPFPAELKPGPVKATTASAALASLPADATGIAARTPDEADGALLVAMPRPLLLVLLGGLVGETPAALPEDRELTEIEASLVEYMARELFLAPLERGWATPDAFTLASGAPSTPRAAWGVPGADPAVAAALTVSTPFGDQPVQLLVHRVGRWDQLVRQGGGPRPEVPGVREQMESLVREMPVELEVVLGSADLTMHDIAGLRAGDVIVLRQKVTQPLDGFVSGSRKFRVWPGTIGPKAAVLIDANVQE